MKALKKTLAAVAATALFSIGTTAQAGVIIDLFQDSPSQEAKTSKLGETKSNQVETGGVIGGWRDLSITKTHDSNSDFPNDGESRIAAGGGFLSIDNADGNRSLGVVTWDGENLAGDKGAGVNTTGLNYDLTHGGASNALLAIIQSVDTGFSYEILVWDMLGNSSTLSAAVQFAVDPESEGGPTDPVLGPIKADYKFDWFNLASNDLTDPNPGNDFYLIDGLKFTIERTGDGLVDFTQIGALQLKLYNTTKSSVDLSLGRIETVPEPDTLALIGVALFGAAAVARRRKA